MKAMTLALVVLSVVMLLGVTARAQDVTPPEIVSAISNPGYLWPPNHKMIEVKINAVVTDDTDLAPTFSIISVECDEDESAADPDEEVTGPDWAIIDGNTVDLRAERLGSGSGRTYTITIEASDSTGNTVTEEVTVLVPHDQGDMREYRHEVKAQEKLFKQQQKAARKEEKERAKSGL